jgi:hypothetical protein
MTVSLKPWLLRPRDPKSRVFETKLLVQRKFGQDQFPNLLMICWVLIPVFEVSEARTALSKTLKRPEYPEERVKIGDFVPFYRERDKVWKVPVRVVSLDNNRVNVVYDGSHSSAARIAIPKIVPPFPKLVDPDMIEEECSMCPCFLFFSYYVPSLIRLG